jgi:superfamily II DNA or RNA helicase
MGDPMTLLALRDYQLDCVNADEEAFKNEHAVLNVLPTGTGKTVCFAHLIDRYCMNGDRALVVAHRDILINQAARKIFQVTGENPEIELAQQWADSPYVRRLDGQKSQTIVSSVQTQNARRGGGRRMDRFKPEEFNLLVIDEAHHAPAETYRRLIDYYRQNPDLRVLGVTATPDRADEKALGMIFDSVAYDMEIADAIHGGWLVPIKQQMIEVEDLDFSEVHTVAGDLNQGELDAIIAQEKIVHRMVAPTLEIVGDRKTLFFTTSIAAAHAVCELINRYKGREAAMTINQKTPKEERKYLLGEFHKGTYQFFVNCMIATEGFDCPDVEVIAIGRPTKSRALYAQMVGRGTRPIEPIVQGLNYAKAPTERCDLIKGSAKPHMLVLDYCGNAGRHKLMSTADILGGRYDDDVLERAAKILREEGEERDTEEVLVEADKQIEREEQARRKAVQAKARYRQREINPFDVFDMRPAREKGWHIGRRPTDKMKAALRKFKVDDDRIERMSFTHASQLLSELIDRIKGDLCSYGQAKILWKFGEDINTSFKEASAKIDAIAKNGWKPLPSANYPDKEFPF